jgi:hypothetical protein
MREGRSGLMLEPLRSSFGAGTAAGLTDAQLLERFATRRDENAEAALVAWYRPMVRRVCHSLLDDPNDAEDVFQATFLVLAWKAGTIRRAGGSSFPPPPPEVTLSLRRRGRDPGGRRSGIPARS